MANPLDTDAGSELFSSYEAELKLVQADLSQKLDQITELSGEERKSAVRLAERTLEEAKELVSMTGVERPHPQNSRNTISVTNYPLFPPTNWSNALSWIKCESKDQISRPPPAQK